MNQIERGTGRPLLLIHGLGGSWRSCSTVLDALAAERTVIAVDLSGHRGAPAEPDSGTFDGLADSLASGPEQTGPAAPGVGRIVIGWGRHDRLCLPRQAARASRPSVCRAALV